MYFHCWQHDQSMHACCCCMCSQIFHFLWQTTNGDCFFVSVINCVIWIWMFEYDNMHRFIEHQNEHTHGSLYPVHLFVALQKKSHVENAQVHIQSLPTATDSISYFCPCFFIFSFSLSLSFSFFHYFILHFTTFPCYTTLFILHAVFYFVCMCVHCACKSIYDVWPFVCSK